MSVVLGGKEARPREAGGLGQGVAWRYLEPGPTAEEEGEARYKYFGVLWGASGAE